jgi:hypothetical protein
MSYYGFMESLVRNILIYVGLYNMCEYIFLFTHTVQSNVNNIYIYILHASSDLYALRRETNLDTESYRQNDGNFIFILYF